MTSRAALLAPGGEIAPRVWRPLLVAALVVIGAAACVAYYAAIWPLNQRSEAALTRRAQQYWDYKVAGDPARAYELMASSYRRRVPLAGFANQPASGVSHTGARVLATRIDGDGASVDVELRYRAIHPRFSSMETTSVITERWIFEGNAWYRWPVG